MKKTSLVIFICTLLISVACSEKTTSETSRTNLKTSDFSKETDAENHTAANPQLLQAIAEANTKCRGLPSDSPEGVSACDERQRLMQEAERNGWCWGPQNSYGYEKHWIRCVDDPANKPKQQWFAHNLNHNLCIESQSPADKMRDVQSFGQMSRVSEPSVATVEVEVDIGYGRSEVWTFYRTSTACEASLPKSQKISGKYE